MTTPEPAATGAATSEAAAASEAGPDSGTAAAPLIGIVVLTYNRVDLLAACLRSVVEETAVPFALVVVDNGSDEPSRGTIDPVCAAAPGRRALYLEKQIAGDALTAGIAALGQPLPPYVLTLENDMELLPGWDREMLADLAAFPKVGVLSPLRYPPAHGTPREGAGRRVWVPTHNVGTTSLTRRAVYDAGVRWHSMTKGLRLPADSRFTTEARAAGFEVAASDEPRVVNHGHTMAEFKRRLPYYIANYAGKVGGVEGFAKRMEAAGHRLTQAADGTWSLDRIAPRAAPDRPEDARR